VNLDLDLQVESRFPELPSQSEFERWTSAALTEREADTELVIRVVDEEESRTLNREYRGKDKPTNVLSFPFDPPPGLPDELVWAAIGDLVICAPVVAQEAAEQGKASLDHWAHMVVHGILHLLGYDHLDDGEAEAMEGREREILATLGVADPYFSEK